MFDQWSENIYFKILKLFLDQAFWDFIDTCSVSFETFET